jgi:hypothetical protein
VGDKSAAIAKEIEELEKQREAQKANIEKIRLES